MKQYKKIADINHQYMDIYHTKKQTEYIPRSCSYLLLQTLFYFISQCTTIPYLESGMCKLGKELDNCNFTFILPRNRSLNESYYEVCKNKTLGITGLFSLHIERPSYVQLSAQNMFIWTFVIFNTIHTNIYHEGMSSYFYMYLHLRSDVPIRSTIRTL